MDEDNSLSHYGVRGMKWGVRKARPSGGIRRVKRAKVKSTFKRIRNMSVSAIRKTANKASKANDAIQKAAEKHRERKLTRVTQKAKIQEQENRVAQQKLQEELNKRNLKEASRSTLNNVSRKVASAVAKASANAASNIAKSAGNMALEALKDKLAKNTWAKYESMDTKDLNDRQLEKMEKRLDRQNKVEEAMKKATKKPVNSFAVAKSKIKVDPTTGIPDFSGLNDDELKDVYNRLVIQRWLAKGQAPNPRFFTN